MSEPFVFSFSTASQGRNCMEWKGEVRNFFPFSMYHWGILFGFSTRLPIYIYIFQYGDRFLPFLVFNFYAHRVL